VSRIEDVNTRPYRHEIKGNSDPKTSRNGTKKAKDSALSRLSRAQRFAAFVIPTPPRAYRPQPEDRPHPVGDQNLGAAANGCRRISVLRRRGKRVCAGERNRRGGGTRTRCLGEARPVELLGQSKMSEVDEALRYNLALA
jgi:hypothetical protein